jgi:hypothetical protein
MALRDRIAKQPTELAKQNTPESRRAQAWLKWRGSPAHLITDMKQKEVAPPYSLRAFWLSLPPPNISHVAHVPCVLYVDHSGTCPRQWTRTHTTDGKNEKYLLERENEKYL